MKRYGGDLVFRSRDEWGDIEVVDDAHFRSLHFGTLPKQSSMALRDPVKLVLAYTQSMLAPLLFMEGEPQRVLVIGLGGGSLPKFILHHFAEARVDVVEIRAAVHEVAVEYFGMRDEGRLQVHLGDGGEFIRESGEEYDLILLDAYHPKGMSTSVSGGSFFDACRARLSSRGMLAINLWSADAIPVGSVLLDMQAAFGGFVLQLPVANKDNIIAIAGAHPGREALQRVTGRAHELSERLDLGFAAMLRMLRYYNPGRV